MAATDPVPATALRPRPVVDSVDELLADATDRQPFLSSDSKSGNPFERVVIGRPICHELGWYLALNSARLPEPKETTIDAFRVALEHHGIATST